MTSPWLSDLKGKSVIVNAVPLPDRKTLNLTILGATATDDPSNNATVLDFGKGELVSKDSTGLDYPLTVSDSGYQIKTDNASANTVTIPLNATQAIPIDSVISVLQIGAGETSVLATGGVTINFYDGGVKLKGQWATAVLQKTGTDVWLWTGQTKA